MKLKLYVVSQIMVHSEIYDIKKINENRGDILLKDPIKPCLSSAPTTTPKIAVIQYPLVQRLVWLAKEMTTFDVQVVLEI